MVQAIKKTRIPDAGYWAIHTGNSASHPAQHPYPASNIPHKQYVKHLPLSSFLPTANVTLSHLKVLEDTHTRKRCGMPEDLNQRG